MNSPDIVIKAKRKFFGRSGATSSNFSHRDSATVASQDAMISSQKFISVPISEAAKPYKPIRHARLKSAVVPPLGPTANVAV